MSSRNNSNVSPASSDWSSKQAYVLAVICLVVGVAAGYFLRGSGSNNSRTVTASQMPAAPAMGDPNVQVTPEQLKHMAEVQAAPLLTQLKTSPNDAPLLAKIGNVYFDAQQFKEAADYYQQSLRIDPKNTGVRTDLGTAVWSLGDADAALVEFDKALKFEPTKATTLFNLGIVKWQGKMDINGALAAWDKLLKTNPDYPERAKVEELMARAKQHNDIAPGTKTDKPVK